MAARAQLRWLHARTKGSVPLFIFLALWLSSIWFLLSGITVLFHPELSNFHSLPHFIPGITLLFFAIRRSVRDFGGFTKTNILVFVSILILIFGGIFFTIANNANYEFRETVGEHSFNTNQWTLRINSEDFADFVTWWNNPPARTSKEEAALVLAFFDYSDEERSLERKYDHEGLTEEETNRLVSVRNSRKAIQRDVERIMSEQVDILFNELGINSNWYQKIIRGVQQTDFRFVPRISRLIVTERNSLTIYARETLNPELTNEERDAIEARVESLGYSALIVGLGGIGTSPSIVIPQGPKTTLRTISHERIHVLLYSTSLGSSSESESRIIEETVASLLGDAIGDMVYCKYYDAETCAEKSDSTKPTPSKSDPDKFNHRAVLRETHLMVEEMLKGGRILEAEAYMDAQREYLEANGHFIRKINQAYFAFYGAYADNPEYQDANGGIGRKLRELWDKCPSPDTFFTTIRDISSLNELEKMLSGEIKNACTK